MGSKAEILAAIRRQQVPKRELPSLDQAWIRYDDPATQFATVLATVGGRCVSITDWGEAQRVLAENPTYAAAKQAVSLVPELATGNVQLAAIEDPRALETIDYMIAPGHFAVAENAAIWVTDEAIRHRAALFICQHLVLVVRRSDMLNNMHEAYDRLAFPQAGFGVFISGPSKTADIEQSLVIGAHGPRSLTVFVAP